MSNPVHRLREVGFLRHALFFAGLVVVLLELMLSWRSSSARSQYRADAFVVMRPFTNAVLEPSFERGVIRSIPGVSRLYFQRSIMVHTAQATAPVTNEAVVIQVAAVGTTAEAAQQNANDAVPRLCALLRQLYGGVTAELLNQAHGARPLSFWHDGLELRLGRRRDMQPMPPSGEVVFTGSGVSLDPGPNWEQHYTGIASTVRCEPTLVGLGEFNGGFIGVDVHPLGTDVPNLKSAVAHLRSSSLKHPQTINGSFKEDEFTTDSGLHGICASFAQADGSGANLYQTRHFDYLVTNAQGRCVDIHYMAVAGKESGAIHRMIRQTLRLSKDLP